METKVTSTEQAYEWVKTGVWSLREFVQWVDTKIEDAENDGFNRAEDYAYDCGGFNPI